MDIELRESLHNGGLDAPPSLGWEDGPRRATAKGMGSSSADRIRAAAALNFLSPLQGITLARWSQILARGWRHTGPPYWPRALLLTASSLFNTAFARYEDWTYSRALDDIVIPPPLFVLGHYRSGTTHLHQLLSLNRAFAYPNLYQSFFPHTFLSTEKYLAPLVELGLVRHRFQDRVALSVRSPMEDEIALCVSTGLSPHMSWALPNHSVVYDRFLTFQDATVNEVKRWKSALRLFVQKLTLKYGRPLVLKSPPHTGRIRLLLEIFPNAQFVHIRRDPHAVFRSTLHMLEAVNPYWNLHGCGKKWTEEARIERVLTTYRIMYDAFFEQRHLIPSGRLYELSYEQLEQDPEGSVRMIYSALELPGIDQQVASLRNYLTAYTDYPKNSYSAVNNQLRERVARAWVTAFQEWGYPM